MGEDASSIADSKAGDGNELIRITTSEHQRRREELRGSLHDLRVLAHVTTGRLDNTNFSLLEKFDALQDSVAALRDLSTSAAKLNDEFAKDSEGLTKELQQQLDAFQEFATQHKSIESLQSRIVKGQVKVNKLSERVEDVRHRAEAWSRVEAQWEESTRRRIKLFWAISAAVLILVVGLLVFQYGPSRQPPGLTKSARAPEMTEMTEDVNELERDLATESMAIRKQTKAVVDDLRGPERSFQDDPRLRVFDEL